MPMNHDVCRSKVCVVCWCGSGKKATIGITPELERTIKQHLLSSYSLSDERFPTGLCSPCQRVLSSWSDASSENPRKLPFSAKWSKVYFIKFVSKDIS